MTLMAALFLAVQSVSAAGPAMLVLRRLRSLTDFAILLSESENAQGAQSHCVSLVLGYHGPMYSVFGVVSNGLSSQQ